DGLHPAHLNTSSHSGSFDFDPTRYLLVAAGDSAGVVVAQTALMTDPDVVWVEPNAVREPAVLPAGYPSDPLFVDTRQWGLRNLGPDGVNGGLAGADIHAVEAWAISVGAN